jgi:hypothetical protein
MHLLLKPLLLLGSAAFIFAGSGKNNTTETTYTPVTTPVKAPAPKIQVAVLLDVSNSMDGLIEQAKAQLWNMVSVMGRAKCGNGTPQIEIALYEYGRSSNDASKGYVKQINPFSSDLDEVSKNLFNLTTNGGSEYCGQVIYSSLEELAWDSASTNYKTIFIAGNEDFLQGNITYTKACEEARKKGVVVNTIYCGDRLQGIREHWELAGECGNGNFTCINQNAKIPDIPTPYDSTLISLNYKLNGTYIGYGSMGAANFAKQAEVDKMNASAGATVAAKRTAVKGKSELYYNGSWDVVDAARNNKDFVEKVDLKSLPDSLQNKSRAELKQFVAVKQEERSQVQKEIATTNTLREKYIAEERAKATTNNNAATLETEVEKIIKVQAKRYNMIIQ